MGICCLLFGTEIDLSFCTASSAQKWYQMAEVEEAQTRPSGHSSAFFSHFDFSTKCQRAQHSPREAPTAVHTSGQVNQNQSSIFIQTNCTGILCVCERKFLDKRQTTAIPSIPAKNTPRRAYKPKERE